MQKEVDRFWDLTVALESDKTLSIKALEVLGLIVSDYETTANNADIANTGSSRRRVKSITVNSSLFDTFKLYADTIISLNGVPERFVKAVSMDDGNNIKFYRLENSQLRAVVSGQEQAALTQLHAMAVFSLDCIYVFISKDTADIIIIPVPQSFIRVYDQGGSSHFKMTGAISRQIL